MNIRTATALLFLFSCLIPARSGDAQTVDLKGAWRFDDGRLVSIRQAGEDLRYREYSSGRSGLLRKKGARSWVSGPGYMATSPAELMVQLESREDGQTVLSWVRSGEPAAMARGVNREEEFRFECDGAQFAGRLHLPDGAGPYPAVVIVHGSGEYGAVGVYFDGDFLAAHGVAALVFDKRGTGRSGGEVTHDFDVLADDIVAGVDALLRRRDIDASRIGLLGHSQGGWVAPLAASRSSAVRFVVVNYGLIESPAVEARLEMMAFVRAATNDPEALDRAQSLIDSAVAVVASDFRTGWKEFDARVKAERRESWFEALRDTPVGKMARYPHWLVRTLGRRSAQRGLSWNYDSDATLQSLTVPMLWILGEKDRSAPNAETIRKLSALRSEGKPIDAVVLAGADHTGLVFTMSGKQRVYTGYSPGAFRTSVEWILSPERPWQQSIASKH